MLIEFKIRFGSNFDKFISIPNEDIEPNALSNLEKEIQAIDLGILKQYNAYILPVVQE